MIISVHIRKCAGTTLKQSLLEYFKDEILLDYGDQVGSSWPSSLEIRKQSLNRAIGSRLHISNKYRMIHGHFFRQKYDFLPGKKRYITFMRDPVSRVLSNYFYLKRNIDRSNKDAIIVNDFGFSLEEYVQHPDARNLQSQYLQTTDLSEFDFVGICERYEESIDALNKKLDLNLRCVENQNVNPNATDNYDLSDKMVELIKSCNMQDLHLFDLATKRLR